MNQDILGNGDAGQTRPAEMNNRLAHSMGSGLPPSLRWLHWSLVFVWLLTAVVSVHQWQGQSSELLLAAGIPVGRLQDWLIGGGAAMDLLIGLWLWLRPSRMAYAVALAGMVIMTVMATAILPSLWLHPLGPLSKNLPIAAALLMLMQPTHERK